VNRRFTIFIALLAFLFSASTDALGVKPDLSAGSGAVLSQEGCETPHAMGEPLYANQFGGQCAEVNAISRALNKNLDLTGAKISVSNVRGPLSTSGIHGTAKAPCDVCSPLIQRYGLKYVE
jgi:hypothetical protein